MAIVATYLVAYVIVQKSSLTWVLTWKPLAYLGQRSYGAYLLHFLAIRIGYLPIPLPAGNMVIVGFRPAVASPAAR